MPDAREGDPEGASDARGPERAPWWRRLLRSRGDSRAEAPPQRDPNVEPGHPIPPDQQPGGGPPHR